ncbi:hypothetical protein E3T55_06995 [Cryobacterium frigoriphilum]|uniref:Lipopolysaccharide biosynthesis protein n=1 Tax=Cryobacterium frigoriphilum TaxID=1259150 RepID=A0A4R9A4Q7_9MICO|nr:oligosaccharide flippase family protein [Cryobacterium frigoriphilum]TFD52124.1 hypothetical protein E3T55_06995 [Cryobacterium frigoriphilum]
MPLTPSPAPAPAAISADDRSLGDRVRTGALWAGGNALFLRVANILIMAVVARIVAPAELGVFALTLVVHGIVVSMAELGVASAIARSDQNVDSIAPTVVTISIVTSLTLGTLMAVFAAPLALLLGSGAAEDPLRVMALCVALVGPFAVPGALLQREFRQDLVFRAAAIAFVPGSAVLIVVSLAGDGAMAFAWSRVVGQLVMGSLMLLSVKRRYRPGFNTRVLASLIRFGLPLAFANLLSQVLLNIDYVFVGRFLSIEEVGLYNLAFNISLWSTAVIGSILNGLVLPAFSRVRAEGGDTTDALARGVRTVALIAAPLAALAFALAAPLIVTVYGGQWSAAAPVLRVLSLYGFLSVICLLLANVIVATGRTGVLFWVQAVALAALVPAMWAGVSVAGLIGVAAAHIVVILVATFPLYVLAIKRSLGAGPATILPALAWPAIAAGLAGVAAWLAASLLTVPALQLLTGGAAGALVYLALTSPLLLPLFPATGRLRSVRVVLDVLGRPAAWVTHRIARSAP